MTTGGRNSSARRANDCPRRSDKSSMASVVAGWRARLSSWSGAGHSVEGRLRIATASVSSRAWQQPQPRNDRRLGHVRAGRRSAAAPRAPPRRWARRLERCGWSHRARLARKTTFCSWRGEDTFGGQVPSAIGRSNEEPAFRTSAGARLIVIRCVGNSKAGVSNRRAHAVSALADTGIGQAHHPEERQSEPDIDLDVQGAPPRRRPRSPAAPA